MFASASALPPALESGRVSVLLHMQDFQMRFTCDSAVQERPDDSCTCIPAEQSLTRHPAEHASLEPLPVPAQGASGSKI